MDYSVEDDTRAFLQQAFEQLQVVQDGLAGKRHAGTVKELADMFGDLIIALGEAVFRLSREIDNLRASVGEGPC